MRPGSLDRQERARAPKLRSVLSAAISKAQSAIDAVEAAVRV
jgi:hypothetical protein